MEEIKCKKCKKPVLKTIGADIKASTTYYLNQKRFGYVSMWYWNINDLDVKQKIINFHCRYCGKQFPKTMNEKIFKWIKLTKIFDNLKS